MKRTFKDFKEMMAYLRHKAVEVHHKAVKVEEVKKGKPKKKRTTKKKSEAK